MAEDYAIQTTVVLHDGDLMVNVRGANEAEFARRIEWLIEKADRIEQSFLALTGRGVPPPGDPPVCTHDGETRSKEFRSGRDRNGAKYRAWACWLPKEREGRCAFQFIE